MKTEVIVKRPILGGEVSQKSQSEFLSATDLIKVANKWRAENGMELRKLEQYFKLESTKTFYNELEKEMGEIKINSRGKNSHTWVHPILFIDIALWLSPALKIKVYQWLYDNLLKYRNSSGDSYRKLFYGCVEKLTTNKAKVIDNVKIYANKLKEVLVVEDWDRASEKQLELRDKIINNFDLTSGILRDLPQAFDIAIKKAMEDK